MFAEIADIGKQSKINWQISRSILDSGFDALWKSLGQLHVPTG